MDNSAKARTVLEQAHAAWNAMSNFRERRHRYIRYTYGDQWSDPVKDRFGNIVTEGELFSVGGRRPPLSNNLIRRMVKAVVGRYRMEESEYDTTENLGKWHRINSVNEIDARTLEEFLISGMAVQRVWRERRTSGEGVWIDTVSPDKFFINAITDSRGNDTELIGRLIDMSMPEVIMRFAKGDRKRAINLRELYASIESNPSIFAGTGASCGSFFHSNNERCRVIEVWTLESREAYRCHDSLEATYSVVPPERCEEIRRTNNRRRRNKLPLIEMRWDIITAWHCRMFAPDGTVLDEYDSPLQDGNHPFAIKMYPLIDGQVHSLVEDVIDQQRYVNRLITLMDIMMSTAAKGVLLYPTACKPDGQPWEKVAEAWADPGGVLPYRPFQGAEPHQVITPMSDFGAKEMLSTQIELFEDVSGVSEALLGKSRSATMGVERYESEVRNASVAVNDLIKTFRSFTDTRNMLIEAC